jgi:hypothetical protein
LTTGGLISVSALLRPPPRSRAQGALDFPWEVEKDEELRRVQVVLTGFVNDSDVPPLRREFVRKDLVELAQHYVLALFGLNA